MKKILLLLLIISCTTIVYGQQYVPFPTANAQWNICLSRSIDNSFSSPYIKSITSYFIQGDTVINDKTYHKLYSKSDELGTRFYGGLREEDKRIYYLSCGTGGYSLQVKSLSNDLKDCLKQQIRYSADEVLLYDFNKNRVGDSLITNYPISYIDSVWIQNAYRKRYKIPGDYVIEGIGSVKQGLFGYITPIPMCSYFTWEFLCFSQNGESVYINPSYSSCNSTESKPTDTSSYFGNSSCWSYKGRIYEQLFDGFRIGTGSYTLAGDTVINFISYKKLRFENGNSSGLTDAFIRQEDQKIFAFSETQQAEFLLYDFSAVTNDVINSTAAEGLISESPVVGKVDSITMYNGEKRKRMYVNGDIWIEGIGSIYGLMYPTRVFVTCDCNDTYELISFAREDHVKFYNSGLCADYTCCTGILDATVNFPETKNTVIVSPNPVYDELTVKFETETTGCSIELFNMQGRRILQKKLDASQNLLDMHSFSSGLYLYRLTDNGKIIQTGKIIKM